MSEPNKLGHGGRLRFLAKDAAVYGIGGALTKLLSLITFPLLARHFSVQDFGLIDLLNTAVLLLSVLLAFGLDSAVARFFYENEEIDYRRQIVSQALTFQVAILAVALPLLWVNTDVLGSFIDAGPNGRIILHLLILQSPLFVLLGFAQSLLKWTFRRWLYMLISVGSIVMTVIGLVVGIVFFNFGVVEVFIVYLATRAIFAIIGLWCVRRWLTVPTGWDRLKEMLPFAAPIGVVCVMGALLPFMERSMVQSLLGAEELGLYAAGAKVGMLISLPMAAFEIAWGPFALSIFKEKDASESFRHVLRSLCGSHIYDGPGFNRACGSGASDFRLCTLRGGRCRRVRRSDGAGPAGGRINHLGRYRLFEKVLSETLRLRRDDRCRCDRHSTLVIGLRLCGRGLGKHVGLSGQDYSGNLVG